MGSIGRREDDTYNFLFLCNLKLALENLGKNLTNNEIELLVKRIEEDKGKGVTEDFISVLIFASKDLDINLNKQNKKQDVIETTRLVLGSIIKNLTRMQLYYILSFRTAM